MPVAFRCILPTLVLLLLLFLVAAAGGGARIQAAPSLGRLCRGVPEAAEGEEEKEQ